MPPLTAPNIPAKKTAQPQTPKGKGNGNGSTKVTMEDIRALSSQFTHKWVASYVAATVKADSILGRQFGKLSGKEGKLNEYRAFLSAKLADDEKQSLNVANRNPMTIHVCSGLAMSGMISPIMLKVFFQDADNHDLALINDVRKITALGKIDQAQLESEGAKS